MTLAVDFGGEDLREADHYAHLRGLSWADYQRFVELRGDSAVPRLTFLEGVLEIMTPSRPHESYKTTISRLVEVWCLEHGVEFSAYGSWTLENPAAERGAEPDECYVFGTVPNPTRPDLAIEVVMRSGGIDKLEVYRALEVGEVWYFRHGKIQPYVLSGDHYEPREHSECLPGLDLDQLVQYLDFPSTSQALRAYRAAITTAG